MNQEKTKPLECAKCKGSLPDDVINYCPHCGKKIGKSSEVPMKLVLAALVVGIGVWWFTWNSQRSLVGTGPTVRYNPTVHADSFQYQDPDIQRIRSAIQTRPEDLSLWMSLAKALLEKTRDGIIPAHQGLSDAIDALGHILSIQPEQEQALLLMADLSFDQQAFTKAKEFYERYLEVNDKDDDIWARYASTLNFLGQSDRAAEILNGIIGRNPTHFQAMAFLAITYAQMGQKERSLELAERALPYAPGEEAKQRFQGFIQSLQSGGESEQGPTQTMASTRPIGEVEQAPTFQAAYKIVEYVSQHPIAGEKLAHFETENDILKIYLKDFPMSYMPDFARERFIAPISEFLVGSPLKGVSLIDHESNEVMQQIQRDSED